MELAQDISRHGADRRIACNFPELVSAHAICNNIKPERQIPGIAGHGRCKREQTILIQFTLFPHRLSAAANELLEIKARILVADNGLNLLLCESAVLATS